MVESVHVNDQKTTIWIDVLDGGVSLDTALSGFSTRQVELQKPSGGALITIAGPVAVALDTFDNVTKLRLITGPSDDFEITEAGAWQAKVILADGSGGQWKSQRFPLFKARSDF